ncbi:hypothetical protein M0R45_030747 [Rubus argutus]|uniref:Uncharacterized protein n=1 Tax=Rubus argutus TaxID=59490 RepID=A0AAW1WG95_RUBAR
MPSHHRSRHTTSSVLSVPRRSLCPCSTANAVKTLSAISSPTTIQTRTVLSVVLVALCPAPICLAGVAQTAANSRRRRLKPCCLNHFCPCPVLPSLTLSPSPPRVPSHAGVLQHLTVDALCPPPPSPARSAHDPCISPEPMLASHAGNLPNYKLLSRLPCSAITTVAVSSLLPSLKPTQLAAVPIQPAMGHTRK